PDPRNLDTDDAGGGRSERDHIGRDAGSAGVAASRSDRRMLRVPSGNLCGAAGPNLLHGFSLGPASAAISPLQPRRRSVTRAVPTAGHGPPARAEAFP